MPAHNPQSVRAQPRPQPSKPAVKVYGVGHLADGVGLYMNGVGLIMDPIRATLEEFGPRWALLQEALHSGGGQQAEAALAEHSLAAREEAARKLMSNRERILRDVESSDASLSHEMRAPKLRCVRPTWFLLSCCLSRFR